MAPFKSLLKSFKLPELKSGPFSKKHVVIAKDIIHNKYVLYFVFVVALVQLLFSVVQQDFLYCTLFILIGFLVAFFNKNMIVILVITMTVATVVRAIISGSGLKVEGFKEGASDKDLSDKESSSNNESSSDKDLSDKDSSSNNESSSDKESSDNGLSDNKSSSNKGSSDNTTASSGNKGTGVKSSTEPSIKETKKELLTNMKSDAVELMSVQKDIINGFQTIEPHMNRAESLIGSIQETAKTIQGMRGRS